MAGPANYISSESSHRSQSGLKRPHQLTTPFPGRRTIVSDRASTAYGSRVTTKLASQGRMILSGGVNGLDGSVHRAATVSCHGSTIAVFANGLDRLYLTLRTHRTKRWSAGQRTPARLCSHALALLPTKPDARGPVRRDRRRGRTRHESGERRLPPPNSGGHREPRHRRVGVSRSPSRLDFATLLPTDVTPSATIWDIAHFFTSTWISDPGVACS